MSDPADTPPPKPGNDAEDGSGKVVPMAAVPAGGRQQRHQGDAQPGGGEAAGAGWLDAARREAAHIEREATVHAEAHFDSCARWSWWNTALGFASAVLGALTATTIAAVLGEGTAPAGGGASAWHWQVQFKPLFAYGALVAGVVAAAVRFLDPGTRSAQHGAAGKLYRALADEARQFRSLETAAGAAPDGLFGRLRAMVGTRAKIHEAAPVIPKRAHAAAWKKAAEDPRLRKLAAEAEGPAG